MTADAAAIAAAPGQWLPASGSLPDGQNQRGDAHHGSRQLGPRWQILDASATVISRTASLLPVTAQTRVDAGPVRCFWLADILTRPLGANLSVLFGLSRDEGGLGLGTATTSLIFLAVVVYLTVVRKDWTETIRNGRP